MSQQKTWKPMGAFIGARPSLNALVYIYCFANLLMQLLGCVVIFLLILSVGYVFILLLRYPQHALLLWLQKEFWTLFEVTVFLIATSIAISLSTKRAIEDVKGLIVYAHAKPDHLPSIPLSKHIEVSLPPWLQSSAVVDLSENALDSLRQHIDVKESWLQDFMTVFHEQNIECPPPINILISLRSHITISILGQNNNTKTISITQEQTAAIVAFLAFRQKGKWIPRQEIVQQIYGNNDANITSHTSRLNKPLNAAIQKVTSPAEQEEEDVAPSNHKTKFLLIEYHEQAKEHFWRLSTQCSIEIYPELEALYRQLKRAKEKADGSFPGHDELFTGCHRIMESYKNGLFAAYQKRHPQEYWPWATEYYTEYRDKCLFILDEAAKQAWDYADHNEQDPVARHTAIRHTAQLCTWILEVSLGTIPHLHYAQQAVALSIELYRSISDLKTARKTFKTYAMYMLSHHNHWRPPDSLRTIWPKAIVMPKEEELSY